MTKRLDINNPQTDMAASQTSSTSPAPTSSSSFHQQKLSSSTLSPTTSMAQLSTNSPPTQSQPASDQLATKLNEIITEKRALQQRQEILERMVCFVARIYGLFFSNHCDR